MPKKTTKKNPTRKQKRAPLAIGGKKGSAGSADADVLARIEEDLIAAIEDAEAALKQLRGRLEELRSERAAAQPVMSLMAATPMGPSNPRID